MGDQLADLIFGCVIEGIGNCAEGDRRLRKGAGAAKTYGSAPSGGRPLRLPLVFVRQRTTCTEQLRYCCDDLRSGKRLIQKQAVRYSM